MDRLWQNSLANETKPANITQYIFVWFLSASLRKAAFKAKEQRRSASMSFWSLSCRQEPVSCEEPTSRVSWLPWIDSTNIAGVLAYSVKCVNDMLDVEMWKWHVLLRILATFFVVFSDSIGHHFTTPQLSPLLCSICQAKSKAIVSSDLLSWLDGQVFPCLHLSSYLVLLPF